MRREVSNPYKAKTEFIEYIFLVNPKALGTNLFSYRKPVKGEGKKKRQMECFHPQNIFCYLPITSMREL